MAEYRELASGRAKQKMEEAKTKVFASMIEALGVKAPLLLILDEIDSNLELASRNIPLVEVARATDVNVYQLLRYPTVVVNSAGMDQLKTRLEK